MSKWKFHSLPEPKVSVNPADNQISIPQISTELTEMAERIFDFLQILSVTTLVSIIIVLALATSSIRGLFKKEKIIVNIICLGLSLLLAKPVLGFIANDISMNNFKKNLTTEIENKLNIQIKKLEHQPAGRDSYHVNIYGSELPSKEACEARHIILNRNSAYSPLFRVREISLPYECGTDLQVALSSPTEEIMSHSIFNNHELVEILEGTRNSFRLLKLDMTVVEKDDDFILDAIPSKNPNSIVNNSRIQTGEGIYPDTTLSINEANVLEANMDRDGYMLSSAHEFPGEPEMLILGVYEGGNSCSSSRSLLLIKNNETYSASKPFGRCQSFIQTNQAKGVTFFTQEATEYEPKEVYALVRVEK